MNDLESNVQQIIEDFKIIQSILVGKNAVSPHSNCLSGTVLSCYKLLNHALNAKS